LIGTNVGNRRRYTAALIDRAEQLTRERDAQAQLASAAERSRIAREMHDIVAHSLTVVVALANGAEAAAERSPELAQQAMREVRDVGRSALKDMRRLLGVLRDSDETAPDDASSALRPQPGNDDIAQLIASYRAAGLPVTLTLRGEPPTSAGLQLTVHRIVQESLTNVLRYAQEPTKVTVTIVSSPTQIAIDVRDNGRGRQASPVEGSGQGLIGMRERVSIYSGTLEVGPGTAGGWHVRAVLFADPEETP
jgi:signal transduction histidine kinase